MTEQYTAPEGATHQAVHDVDLFYRPGPNGKVEYACTSGGEPVHAQEAYAIGLAKRMYQLAVEGLGRA